MPRGFRRDAWATKFVLDQGLVDIRGLAWRPKDKRSFLSQAKLIVGECDQPMYHIIAYGEDKAPIRAEIFRRNREENGGVNRCWKCRKRVTEQTGEWDHIRNKPGERCDCPENGRVACRDCHRLRHTRIMSGKVNAG